jgi:membrane protein
VRDFPFSTEAERGPGRPTSTKATAASSPYRLGASQWLAALKAAGKKFVADDGFGLAQQIAFSSLLAFFPTVILIVGLLGVIGPGAYDSLVHLLGTVAPKAVLDAINVAKRSSTGNSAGSSIALTVGIVGAVWAASGATNSIIKAVNRASEIEETRKFWRVRLLALALVVLTGLVTAAVFVLIVFGGPLGDAIAKRADLGHQFIVVWQAMRWPIAFAGLVLFNGAVYWLAPNRRPPNWKWLTPGSVLAATLWLALSAVFSLYTSYSSSYDRTYGSLAGVIVLLLWLDYSAVALLFGAEVNAELERRASASRRPRQCFAKPS